jgi:hypothetical protein
MTGKENILREIQATAEQLGGKTPGRAKFIELTGITEYEIGLYWPRWTDAVIEAGLEPQKFVTMKYGDDELLEFVVLLTRRLGHFPVRNEIRMERRNNSEFPDTKVIENRFGAKQTLLRRVHDFTKDRLEYLDVLQIVSALLVNDNPGDVDASSVDTNIGFVYLVKMDKWFKIGKTNDILRRTGEIRLTLPERESLIHTIETVDPSGVEAYWHKRFDSRRRNGEWFLLLPSDVKEFKMWRRIS